MELDSLLQYITGNASNKMRKHIDQWLNENESNQKEFLELKMIFDLGGRIDAHESFNKMINKLSDEDM